MKAKLKSQYQLNSTAAQRHRIKMHLSEHGSATTIELRHNLDVLMPAARIFELRHRDGCKIETIWVDADNPGGGSHRVAKYLLREAI